MARKPNEEAISIWKNRKQTPADAKTNGATNLLFIPASPSTSNMGPPRVGPAPSGWKIYASGVLRIIILRGLPPRTPCHFAKHRKRPQPARNTAENSLKQAL